MHVTLVGGETICFGDARSNTQTCDQLGDPGNHSGFTYRETPRNLDEAAGRFMLLPQLGSNQ